MNSTQDSTALPSSPKNCVLGTAAPGFARLGLLDWLDRLVLLGLLGILGVLGGGSLTLHAQVALEIEPGSARIWSHAATSEQVSVSSDRLPLVVVAAEDGYVIAGEDLVSGDLFFLHRAGGRTAELPTPPSQGGLLRSSPVLLTDDNRLEGCAWLEGSNQQDFTVLASAWNGTSWERVESVSIQKTGPQLALSATVLEDGTWLLLWAGFDGTDDDIFWSRRLDGIWSKPRRLHADNRVPDILPTVTATGNSAHAAWSFFDGNDYRIQTARWTGSGWAAGPILTGRGPGQAAFETVAGRSFLTFRTVVPEVWNLVEFDPAGMQRQTAVASPFTERPLLVLEEGSPASLQWPWRSEVEQP